jgi:hypothetical protein
MAYKSDHYTSLPWHEVWRQALWPSVSSYRNILKRQNNVSLWVAALWIAASSFVALVVSFLARYSDVSDYLFEIPLLTAGVLLGVLILYELRWLLLAGVSYLMARAFGGSAQSREQLYIFAAFFAPSEILLSIVDLFCVIGNILLGFPEIPRYLNIFVWLPVGVYQVILSVIALEAIHDFGWAKACASALPVMLASLLYLLFALWIW